MVSLGREWSSLLIGLGLASLCLFVGVPYGVAQLPERYDQPAILGFDPGRQKCGIAVMRVDRSLLHHEVVTTEQAIPRIQALQHQFPISLLVLGNQTTSKEWRQRLSQELPEPPGLVLVDERNSTLEARDRYWQMFPPAGLVRFVPQSFRTISRPIDDIVAILLIERYLEQLVT